MLGTVLRVVDTEVVSVLLLDVPVVELLVRLAAGGAQSHSRFRGAQGH